MVKTHKVVIALAAILIIPVLFFAPVGYFYKPKVEIPSQLKGQTISIEGNKIRYYQAGEGPNLLMIHACPGSIEDFDPIFNELAKNYRVTVYDRPGQGYSEGKHNLYSLNYNAEVAQDLIKKLQLKNVVVVGHSYGGGTALAMAIKNDPNLRAFVLIGSPGYGPVHLGPLDYLLGIPYIGRGLSVFLTPVIGPKIIRSKLIRGFSPNENTVTQDDLELRVQMISQPRVPVNRARELLNLEHDLEANAPHYKGILRRVTIIQGQQDEVTKAAWKLHEDITGSQLVVLDGVGHYPQFAKPEEVVRIIEDVMKP